MNANHILDALEMIDDNYIIEAKEIGYMETSSVKNADKKALFLKRMSALIAVIAVLLTLCGSVAYQLGWFDPWLQNPSASPTETVRSAIENQIGKDYTISVQIMEVRIDEEETARVSAMYSGSELANARGWTDDYLAEHFVVVWANYYVEYDHSKTFMDDGYTEQYFYLIRDTKTGEWTITDNTSPNTTPL